MRRGIELGRKRADTLLVVDWLLLLMQLTFISDFHVIWDFLISAAEDVHGSWIFFQADQTEVTGTAFKCFVKKGRKIEGKRTGVINIGTQLLINVIGVYYGTPQVTSGGIPLKFFASVRLEICSTWKIKSVMEMEEIGVRVRVRVQKSKFLQDVNHVRESQEEAVSRSRFFAG
ncbi:hypothetical protein L3X38_016694 [Prunus dulcis]|uniref:RecA family profile 2 domain-containing protein n=1 Tax=Prunus dulcis TaxID=3755 RepID=A0AAD4W6Q2_PRUDU|nr:hypothetical protein L3X38_016694 [Prunus dulcis]